MRVKNYEDIKLAIESYVWLEVPSCTYYSILSSCYEEELKRLWEKQVVDDLKKRMRIRKKEYKKENKDRRDILAMKGEIKSVTSGSPYNWIIYDGCITRLREYDKDKFKSNWGLGGKPTLEPLFELTQKKKSVRMIIDNRDWMSSYYGCENLTTSIRREEGIYSYEFRFRSSCLKYGVNCIYLNKPSFEKVERQIANNQDIIYIES